MIFNYETRENYKAWLGQPKNNLVVLFEAWIVVLLATQEVFFIQPPKLNSLLCLENLDQ